MENGILLNVAPILQDDSPPIAAQYSSSADEATGSNSDMADHRCRWVHIARRINDGHHSFERLYHF
jgi:hypothetical protein